MTMTLNSNTALTMAILHSCLSCHTTDTLSLVSFKHSWCHLAPYLSPVFTVKWDQKTCI